MSNIVTPGTSNSADSGVLHLQNMAKANPVDFAGGATYHQVLPGAQAALHKLVIRHENEPGTAEAARRRINRWMQNHRRAFVVTWNCTVPQSQHAGTSNSSNYAAPASNQTLLSSSSPLASSSALCQANGMPSAAKSAPTAVRINGNTPTWNWPPEVNESNRVVQNANVVLVMEDDCCSADCIDHADGSTDSYTNSNKNGGKLGLVGASMAASMIKMIASLHSAPPPLSPMHEAKSAPDVAVILFVIDAKDHVWSKLVKDVEYTTKSAAGAGAGTGGGGGARARADGANDNNNGRRKRNKITLRVVQIEEAVLKLPNDNGSGIVGGGGSKHGRGGGGADSTLAALAPESTALYCDHRVHRRNLVFAGFLLDQVAAGSSILKSLHCTASTIFQKDPFASIDTRDGVAVFITSQPNSYLTRWPPSVGLVKLVFGVCGIQDAKAPPKWIGPGLIDSGVAIGSPTAHGLLLAMTVRRYIDLHAETAAHAWGLPENSSTRHVTGQNLLQQCTPEHVFSRVVWEGRVAEYVPVTIYTPAESPVARTAKTSETEPAAGKGQESKAANADTGARNGRGDLAVIVVA